MQVYDFIYNETVSSGLFFIDESLGAYFIISSQVKLNLPKTISLSISDEVVVGLQNINDDYKVFEYQRVDDFIYVLAKNDNKLEGVIYSNLEELESIKNKSVFSLDSILMVLSKMFRLPSGNYVVSNVQDYISAIEEIGLNYPDMEAFYRGHYSYKYELIPSLYRNKQFYDNESRMYMAFKTQFYNELSNKKYIEILTTMQHYSMPTRLLDTTSNPLVALYMACARPFEYAGQNKIGEVVVMKENPNKVKYSDSNAITLLSCLSVLETEYKQELYEKIKESIDKNDPRIYKESLSYRRFVAEAHNELPYFDESFFSPEVLLYPRHVKVGMINERIIAQSGNFIVFGLCNYQTGEYVKLNTVTKERIFIVNRKYIAKQLEMMNINDGTMYPDKDHRSRSIIREYLK